MTAMTEVQLEAPPTRRPQSRRRPREAMAMNTMAAAGVGICVVSFAIAATFPSSLADASLRPPRLPYANPTPTMLEGAVPLVEPDDVDVPEVELPSTVRGSAAKVFKGRGKKAKDKGLNDPEFMGILSLMGQEMSLAVTETGNDLNMESIMRLTGMVNTIFNRVNLGMASWNNNRNIAKIEAALSRNRAETMAAMFDIEKRARLHGPGGKVTDDSAACGLLWLRRTFEFFVELVDASIENEDMPPRSLVPPAVTAYHRSIGSYHTFMTRTFFRTLLQALPGAKLYIPALMSPLKQSEADKIYRVRGSFGKQGKAADWYETRAAAKKFVAEARKTLRVWEDLTKRYDYEDSRKY